MHSWKQEKKRERERESVKMPAYLMKERKEKRRKKFCGSSCSFRRHCFSDFFTEHYLDWILHLYTVYWLKHSSGLTYADDTSTSVKCDTIDEVIWKLEEDADLVLRFMALNGLVANPSKTTLIILNNNSNSHTCEWVHLNFNQIFTSRQTTFMATKNNRKRVGLNAFANRAFILNGKIPMSWFEMSIDTFKVNCKAKFLSY